MKPQRKEKQTNEQINNQTKNTTITQAPPQKKTSHSLKINTYIYIYIITATALTWFFNEQPRNESKPLSDIGGPLPFKGSEPKRFSSQTKNGEDKTSNGRSTAEAHAWGRGWLGDFWFIFWLVFLESSLSFLYVCFCLRAFLGAHTSEKASGFQWIFQRVWIKPQQRYLKVQALQETLVTLHKYVHILIQNYIINNKRYSRRLTTSSDEIHSNKQ